MLLSQLLVAAMLALGALRTQSDSYMIPSQSELPTLVPGDLVLMWRLPSGKHPARGDLIAFAAPSMGRSVIYLKRVVGVEGDHVALRGGFVILNGMSVPRRQLGLMTLTPDLGDVGGTAVVTGMRFRETLPGGPSYDVLAFAGTALARDTAEVIVPPAHLFVLGDNRDNSLDSRFSDVGPIPETAVRNDGGVIYWAADPHRILQRLR